MGWRDMLEAAAEEVDFGTLGYDGPAALLLAMPPADRIALARELLAGTGRVDVAKTEAADVVAWLLLALNAQQRGISPRDRLISLTARYEDRMVGDIIGDAQRFRAAMLGDEG